MTLNIQALNKLFAVTPPKHVVTNAIAQPLFPGPRAYPSNRAAAEFIFGASFVDVIHAIQADPHWGPIWSGNFSAYGGDQSRADIAICGELARRSFDAVDIDTAIRCSGLYRDKWERSDYRAATLGKALANVPARAVVATPQLGPIDGKISITMNAPSPRRYVLEDLLMPGKAAILAGFGGTSKTQLALQLAIAHAIGKPFMGKTLNSGRVLMILGEEDRDEAERRLSAYARYSSLPKTEVQAVESNICCYPMVGLDIRLTATTAKGIAETDFGKAIIGRAKELDGVTLIILDHLGLLHGGDFNAREDAAQTMRVVNHLAKETNAAVLVLAHTPKSANQLQSSDVSMIAGSTAFVDQARAAWVMATMREAEAKLLGILPHQRETYVSLAVVKNNYGPTGDVFWFRRVPFDAVGLLELVQLSSQAASKKGVADLHKRIVDFVAQHPGQYSKTRLRDQKSGKAKVPFKASKGDVEEAIDELLSSRELVSRAPTDEEKETFGHGPRVKQVLDVPVLT